MKPNEYDNWYASPRGSWIGETEYRLISRQLGYQAGNKILDIGCGTGWFTRRIARLPQAELTGLDIDLASLAFAREQDKNTRYIQGDAEQLPFADNSFDCVLSVTALGFVADWRQALREVVRVTRHRFVIGLLNRHSLLWRDKARSEDQGAYRGTHWHNRREVLAAFDDLAVTQLRVRTAIWFPGGSFTARMIEHCLPNRLPFGSFLLIAGDKAERHQSF